MKISIQDIANHLKAKVEGDETALIHTVAKIEEGSEGAISFLANMKYANYIYSTQATAVIVGNDFELDMDKSISTTLIRVDNPYMAFSELLNLYSKLKEEPPRISKTAIVDPTAKIGKEVFLGEYVTIGRNVVIEDGAKIYNQVTISNNVVIGEQTIIRAGVVIYDDTLIGKECQIHSNTVIGSDGFGFGQNTDDEGYFKVPQIGNVIIEDRVEIGSACTIDRATMGSTIIRQGVKLDNQIQVAHNVEIGKNTVIASQSGIAGSTKVGEHCMFGGQVGIAGHLTIGDKTMIAAQSGISNSVKSKQVIQGSPAIDTYSFNKSYAVFKKLPEMYKQLKSLMKNNG